MQAGQDIITTGNNKIENFTDYRNYVSPVPVRSLVAWTVCQQLGHLTPVLNASCPSPKIGDKPFSLRIIRSFDNFNVVDMGCPTPTDDYPKK